MAGLSNTEWFKAAGALAAAVWLLPGRRAPWADWRVLPRRISLDHKLARPLAAAALGLGLIIVNLAGPGAINRFDTYHYYMGAKYFSEVGYRGLYDCTLAADLEDGKAGDLNRRNIRNLATLRIEKAALARGRAERCRQGFSPGRWQAYRKDVAWFRGGTSAGSWHDMQKVHGFMATPIWLMAGRFLASTGPASDTQLLLLTSIDDLLLGLTWLLVLFTFGPRPALAAAAYWLTNYPARFRWTSGSFLRQPWLALVIGSICWMRRGQHLLAGAALAGASMLRLFPTAFFIGPLFNMGRRLAGGERPRFLPAQRRLLFGAILAGVVVLPLATIATGGGGAWAQFAGKLRAHASSSLTTNMGLKVVASYSQGTREKLLRRPRRADPYAGWRKARARNFQQRRPVFMLLVAGFMLLLFRAVKGKEDWHATVLALGLLPMGVEANCYYYSVMLAYGLLANRSSVTAGGLNLLALAGWPVTVLWPWYDEQYTWMSALVVLFVVAVTAGAALPDEEGNGV